VFGACAGAAIYRRAMLERIGLFDEGFFAYYEDADLSFRAQLAGWRCRYVPEAVVYHRGSATARRIVERALYLKTRNRLAVVIKNTPATFLVMMLPLVLRFQVRLLRQAHGNEQRSILYQALASVVRDLPSLLRARRTTQRLRTISLRALTRILG